MKTKLGIRNITQSDNYLIDLLKAKGIEDVETFLDPPLSYLNSPELLDNVENGANLLFSISSEETIAIVVDCDVDGLTSAAIMYNYIKHWRPTQEIIYFMHEHKQHGLSDIVERILENDTRNLGCVITPDSGTNDYIFIERLKEKQIPVLILDHHILDEGTLISDNCILINNQTSQNYPNKDLTGAGVAWQFCRYLDKKFSLDYANNLIDLAALGIISDMGDYRSLENRLIIDKGLHNIRNYFFQKACEKQDYSMGGKKNYNSVAFYITPLLNSMIRVGAKEEKERVFLAFIDGHHLVPCNKRGAKGTMEEVAVESLRECTNTKSKQDKITTAAVENLSIRIFNEELDKNKLLIVELEDEDDYPQEVNGLVAMKLASKYNLPTLLGRMNDEGELKGSIRGLNNSELISLRDFLLGSGCVDWVTGHDNAAGWCAKKKKIPALIDYANKELANFDFNSSYYEVDFIRRGDAKDLYQIISDIGGHDDIWGQGIK